MRLERSQGISLLAFTIFFVILYFGCETHSKEQEALVKTRAQNLEIINIDRIITESKQALNPRSHHLIESLEDSLSLRISDSIRLELMSSLASLWYQEENPLVSAHYAKRIAEELKTDHRAWSICGTSFAIATKRLENEEQIKYALNNSRQAFENAISLDTENVENRINLALSYVDFPLQENPMKGILMLVDLNKKYPDNVSVLVQLGRLSIQTNQLEKAVTRLTRVLELDPKNKKAHCLLAETYTKMGETLKAEQENKFCNSQF
jgi:tetratricopeptide (TPR) repeat protein